MGIAGVDELCRVALGGRVRGVLIDLMVYEFFEGQSAKYLDWRGGDHIVLERAFVD